MKKYTAKAAAAVFNSLLRSTAKSPRENLRFAWIDKAGRQCVCDGYRAYRISEPLPGLPMMPDHLQPIDIDVFFAPLYAGKVEEMPAPDADAVKAFVEANRVQHKAKRVFNGAAYDLGKCYPCINPLYVLDALKLFPGAKWYVDADPYRRMISPVIVQSEHGAAIILPIRSSAKPCRKPEKPAAPVKPAATEKPAAPVKPAAKRPENIPAAGYAYFLYVRFASRFTLADVGRGLSGVNKLFAPRYKEKDLEAVKALADEVAAENRCRVQIRKLNGKTVVYEAVPTFTPERFAEVFVAGAAAA